MFELFILYLIIGYLILLFSVGKGQSDNFSDIHFVIALMVFPLVWPFFFFPSAYKEIKKRREMKILKKHISKKYHEEESEKDS